MSNPMKPIDTWKRNDPQQSLRHWQRQMLESSARLRFIGADEAFRDKQFDGYCPECMTDRAMVLKANVYIPKGQTVAITNWYPVCSAHGTEHDHGYGPNSRHGNRSASGRPTGWRKNKNEPTNEPDPIPEPVASPPIPDPIIPQGAIRHERYGDVRRLYEAGIRAFLLEGPAGSGKSTIAEHLAEDLKLPIVVVSGNIETDAGELVKARQPISLEEKISELMKAAISGPGFGLVDEVDGIQPSVMLSTNRPIANRIVSVNGVEHKIHPDFCFVFTANASNGANRTYTGRFPMDGATKSRMLPVFCDYSSQVDHLLAEGDTDLLNSVRELRTRVNGDPSLSKVYAAQVGSRLIIQAKSVGKAFGLKGRFALKKKLELGETPDNLRTLGF